MANKKKLGGTSSLQPILLSEVIDVLREDLIQSAEQRSDQWTPLFEIDDVIVEANVKFQRSVEANGKVNIYVVDVGAKGNETIEMSHKVTIKLAPIHFSEKDMEDQGKLKAKDYKKKPMVRGAN